MSLDDEIARGAFAPRPLDLDALRERALPMRGGFYHVVGRHRCIREADFDELIAAIEKLQEDAVVARSVETTLTVRDEERLAALLDAERENTALRLEVERLRIDHHTLMSVAFALADETDHDGYRPERGRDEVVDRALDVRAEVERLRHEVADLQMLRDEHLIDNLHATQEGRDKERAAVVAFLREGDTVCMQCGDRATLDLAYRIELGEHRREEKP